MTNKEKYAIMQITLWVETLTNLLITKNIITNKELEDIFNKNKNEEKYQLDKLEILSNIETISEKQEPLSEEDINYLKTEGLKIDSEENINLLIESLKTKNELRKLFGGLYK